MDHEQAPSGSRSPGTAKHGAELLRGAQPITGRQHTRTSSSQFGAALTAPGGEDRTAGAGAHSQAKAVRLGPTAIVGLEGALAHGVSLRRSAGPGREPAADCGGLSVVSRSVGGLSVVCRLLPHLPAAIGSPRRTHGHAKAAGSRARGAATQGQESGYGPGGRVVKPVALARPRPSRPVSRIAQISTGRHAVLGVISGPSASPGSPAQSGIRRRRSCTPCGQGCGQLR